MKHFLNYINLKTYYVFITFIILAYASNLYQLDISNHLGIFIFLCLLLITIIVSLCLIPKYGTRYLGYVVLFSSQLYLYTLTIICELQSMVFFIMLMSPMLMFIFSDKNLFYLAIAINLLFISSIIIVLTTGIYHWDASILKHSIARTIEMSLFSQLSLILLYYLMRKRLEKMQEFYEEIQRFDRLATSSQLTASIVHEIKNPLTIIKGYLQLVKVDQQIPLQQKEKIDLLLREVEHINYGVNFLLNMSKPNENLKVERIHVEKELSHIIDLMQSFVMNGRVKLTLISKENNYVYMNEVEFKQLFLNIIKNAVEASKSNQTVKIEVHNKDDVIIIKVIDNGCGMTKEQLEKVGTPFFSNKQLGNGLGMMVCNNIVNKYNGKLSIKSEVNKETVVKVVLKKDVHNAINNGLGEANEQATI